MKQVTRRSVIEDEFWTLFFLGSYYNSKNGVKILGTG